MNTLIWDTAWNIGHAEIDEQHQTWLDIFNKLHEAVLRDKERDIVSAQKNALKDMLEYTEYHFDAEERIMEKYAFPDTYKQWRMHKDFKTTVYEYYRKLENGELVLNSHILSLMKNWLLDHIQKEDRKIGLHLKYVIGV